MIVWVIAALLVVTVPCDCVGYCGITGMTVPCDCVGYCGITGSDSTL